MTAGRAIVSSDCGGMPELIEHERTGLLARNGDPESFVQALVRMIEDDQMRARCGAAARAEVEKRLTDVVIAKRSTDVYQAFLAKKPMAVPRVERAPSATPNAAATAQELSELRQRVAKLSADLEEEKRKSAELKNRREWRWGSALLNVATLGGSKRKG